MERRLDASPDYCWFSWKLQRESSRKLLEFGFEWVLPGQGQRIQLSRAQMRCELRAWYAGWVELLAMNRLTAYDYNENVSSTGSIRKLATADFPTRWGTFRIMGFEGEFGDSGSRKVETAVALVMGDVQSKPPLVRIHSQCLTGDVFGSLRCDCRQQLEMALAMIAQEGAGILIYEQQEGRGIGLMAKLQAYALQDAGLDTVEANERLGFKADHREFALPAEILKSLEVHEVRLLSNNPDKVAALENAGVKVIERVPCEVSATLHSEEYLKTKKAKLGHLFSSR